MSSPGAKRSTHEPQFEKNARPSVRVVAPTVIASADPAGENAQGVPLNPDETRTNMTAGLHVVATTPAVSPYARAFWRRVRLVTTVTTVGYVASAVGYLIDPPPAGTVPGP